MDKSQRMEDLDVLRVLATFAVMVLHVASSKWYSTDVRTAQWQALHLWDSLVRWAVPVFVMISGTVFLDRDISWKRLFGKYILRLATAFAFWSLIYALVAGGSAGHILLAAVQGEYHMWFLPMMVGLYLCIPLLRKLAESPALTRYYLMLALMFTFLLPQLVQLGQDFGGEAVRKGAAAVGADLANLSLQLTAGYAGYFLGGWFLRRAGRQDRRARFGLLFLLGFLLTAALNGVLTARRGTPVGVYYGSFTLGVLLESVGIFQWFRGRAPRSDRLRRLVRALSRLSFGAYLVHALVLQQLDRLLGWNALSFHPALAVPAVSAVVFLLSFGVSWLLHRVPVLRDYVV